MARIGLEMHIHLLSPSKLFSPAFRAVGGGKGKGKSGIREVEALDAALPGSLPVLSPTPLRLALLSSLLLSCRIPRFSSFDRKHYFYSDQPAGYQITQQYHPLAVEGKVGNVRIARVQLEQDTAKTFHDHEKELSLINLTRSGAALIEVVTHPDMNTAEEAIDFVRTVQQLFKRHKVGEMSMETGSLRCDVNVSLPNSARVELKNLNGLRSLGDAIKSELTRQQAVIDEGGEVRRETRFFDPFSGATFPLRDKETTVDYRYMPEPDLPVIQVDEDLLEELRWEIETASPDIAPAGRAEGLVQTYGIAMRDADIIVSSGAKEWYEEAVGEYVELAQLIANWTINDLFRELKRVNLSLEDAKVEPGEWREVVGAVSWGEFKRSDVVPLLSDYLASSPSDRLIQYLRTALAAPTMMEQFDLEALFESEREMVEKIKKEVPGKKRQALIGWLVGAATKGARQKGIKIDPKEVRERIVAALS
ncbi:hypothetical protein BT69DRAFT_1351433 [Atractiella rhizophila]|nr:hypothetical protein BT69DRAFT_1351433 [Atractiella rhizophila]